MVIVYETEGGYGIWRVVGVSGGAGKAVQFLVESLPRLTAYPNNSSNDSSQRASKPRVFLWFDYKD
jgi:hypothetical protein